MKHRHFEPGGQGVGNLFETERLEALKGCVNVRRANNECALFLERIPWPLWHFYLKKFYRNRKTYHLECVLIKVKILIRNKP